MEGKSRTWFIACVTLGCGLYMVAAYKLLGWIF